VLVGLTAPLLSLVPDLAYGESNDYTIREVALSLELYCSKC